MMFRSSLGFIRSLLHAQQLTPLLTGQGNLYALNSNSYSHLFNTSQEVGTVIIPSVPNLIIIQCVKLNP